ncbi:hypothetical protein AMJ49_04300 [Parcubacteria bacterium DG_74_2]|nr:MAG: hypothetical protein AMJ49_04300 [Parcubacteria bacterium DG_74_2]
MNDATLIKKLKELKQVKPSQDWVVLTKTQILGEDGIGGDAVLRKNTGIEIGWLNNLGNLIFRPAFATISAIGILVLIGTFGFAQNSLPGDLLYPVKKITERAKIYVLKQASPETQLKLTEQRLKELSEITQANQVKSLSFALKEYETAKIEAEKQVSNLIEQSKTEQEAVAIAKKVAPQLKEINEKEKEILATLGIEPEEQVNGNAEKTVVELLIKDLSSQTLTEEQEEILEQAQELLENQEYQEALIKILILSYPQDSQAE